MYRLKQYSALDWLVRIPRWEYFNTESPEKAKDIANTTYAHGLLYSMAHKPPRLQQNKGGKWVDLN